MSKAVWGHETRGFGRIVISARSTARAASTARFNYAAAKSGIHGSPRRWPRKAHRRGSPSTPSRRGYTETDMVSACRPTCREDRRQDPGRPPRKAEEIARGVMFLIADDAGYITGSTLSNQRRPAHVLSWERHGLPDRERLARS